MLVHGTPYSSSLWRDIARALSRRRRVYVFDHLGYGQSDKHEGQDLAFAPRGRNFAEILRRWDLERPSGVACGTGGAIALRALLLEGAQYSDLTLFDAVTGGESERGPLAQIREHHDVFEDLAAYAHEALPTA